MTRLILRMNGLHWLGQNLKRRFSVTILTIFQVSCDRYTLFLIKSFAMILDMYFPLWCNISEMIIIHLGNAKVQQHDNGLWMARKDGKMFRVIFNNPNRCRILLLLQHGTAQWSDVSHDISILIWYSSWQLNTWIYW